MLLLAGCAGAMGPRSPEDPEAVYDEMAAHYAHARTCVENGSVQLIREGGSRVTRRYQLQFVRGDRWRLWFGLVAPEFLVWADAQHTYVKVPGSKRMDLGPDHAIAIDGVAKVSHDGATAVLRLLLGTAVRPDHLVWVGRRDPHLALLRGIDHGETVELLIDRDRGELRGMTRFVSGGKVQHASEVVFDHDVPVASLEAPTDDDAPTWLGLRTEDAPARVSQVVPGAPADKAGMQIGDEVVSIDGKPIADAKAVVEHAAVLTAKKPTAVVVRRKGVEVPLTVTPELRPDAGTVQGTFVGKPAPALSLPSLTGGAPITLAAGQVTVLDFWATWCGPCTILSPHLDDLTKKFPALRVIGISDEDADDIATYLAKHKVTYPIARDPDDRATKSYLVQGLPTVVVIDKAGVVRYAHVGVPSFEDLDAAIASALK